MMEYLKYPLIDTLKLWEVLEPKMAKEAKVIAENLNKVWCCDDSDSDWNVDNVMDGRHLLSLVPLILSVLTPVDEDDQRPYEITTLLDIGCHVGFLAPFCERLHINYIGVDCDVISQKNSKYVEHIRFMQNASDVQYVRYLDGNVKEINSDWAREHGINPAKTFVLCAYCPPCKGGSDFSQNIKARLARDFEQSLFL